MRFTSVTRAENERWLGKSLEDLVAERGGHPSDVFADWVLENDLEPGVVAMGVSNSDVEGVATMIKDDRVIVDPRTLLDGDRARLLTAFRAAFA